MRSIDPRIHRRRGIPPALHLLHDFFGLFEDAEGFLDAAGVGVGVSGDKDEVVVPVGVSDGEVGGEVFVAGQEVFVVRDEVVEGAGVEGVVVGGVGFTAVEGGGGEGGEGEAGEEGGGEVHGG